MIIVLLIVACSDVIFSSVGHILGCEFVILIYEGYVLGQEIY